MDQSTSSYGRHKYTVKLADLTALGAALTGDITLDSLPPATYIHTVLIKATTAMVGVTAATAQLKLNGTLIGATCSVSATTGALQINTTNPASLTAVNALVVGMVCTTTNWSTLTAGQFDVIINYHTLAV
jgi:NADPH-dependent curcumin reductase CurA